jgi:hypothetical protein
MGNQHDYTSITTVDAAFQAEGIDLNTLGEMFANVPEKFRPFIIATMKKAVSTAAINGDHVANVADTTEKKHLPVWWVKPNASGGFGLSLLVVHYGITCADVGARLTFETEEKGQHYAENFNALEVEYYSS